VTRYGEWMGAVLACGPEAALSDECAGIAFGIRPDRRVPIEVSIPPPLTRSHPGIVVHRRRRLAGDVTRHRGIPITTPVRTLFDLAARRAGLPEPLTRYRLNGFRVDFYWPELGLVVETDGLRYHRTPAEQARDRLRDQAHAAAGLTALRFTHAQIRWEAAQVERTLTAVADRGRR
jgi:hypothetical protein